MEAILMSIKPEWVIKILNGEKTTEIRRKFPSDYVGWVYIYCTKGKPYVVKEIENEHKTHQKVIYELETKEEIKGVNPNRIFNGKVVARFWCDKVEKIEHRLLERHYTATLSDKELLIKSCLSHEEIHNYLRTDIGKAIHITKLEIFDKPKEIKEFYKVGYGECAKPQGSLREIVIENYNNALKYQLTRAPQSFCFIEV